MSRLQFGTPPPPAHHKCIVCKSKRFGYVNGEWVCLDCRDKKARTR